MREWNRQLVKGGFYILTVQHSFKCQLETTFVLDIKPPEGIPLFEITLCSHLDRYHKYCLWQNQFPCFVRCGAISSKCCILSWQFPLHMSPHEMKLKWKVEQEIEKRVLLCCGDHCTSCYFLLTCQSCRLNTCMFTLSNNPRSAWGKNSAQTCVAILLVFPRFRGDLCSLWHFPTSKDGTQQLAHSLLFFCGL